MRTSFFAALMATAASAYKLTDFNVSDTISVTDGLSIKWEFSAEIWLGLRNPVMFAEYMDWKEAVAILGEVYSFSQAQPMLNITWNNDNGYPIFYLTAWPRIQGWDIAFFEELFMYWPKTEEHCNY